MNEWKPNYGNRISLIQIRFTNSSILSLQKSTFSNNKIKGSLFERQMKKSDLVLDELHTGVTQHAVCLHVGHENKQQVQAKLRGRVLCGACLSRQNPRSK